MAITWRTDYAIRIMYELACLGAGERATVRSLSESANVPYDFARVISHDLVQAGLLNSRRGVGGGVELASSAESITLREIFSAMGEPASMALCTTGEVPVCPRTGTCAMHHGVWTELDRRIDDYLSSVTLADTVKNGVRLSAAANS